MDMMSLHQAQNHANIHRDNLHHHAEQHRLAKLTRGNRPSLFSRMIAQLGLRKTPQIIEVTAIERDAEPVVIQVRSTQEIRLRDLKKNRHEWKTPA